MRAQSFLEVRVGLRKGFECVWHEPNPHFIDLEPWHVLGRHECDRDVRFYDLEINRMNRAIGVVVVERYGAWGALGAKAANGSSDSRKGSN